MRKTIMTRSIVTAATIAIGSAALAATPANAAAANGVTRDQVITAVNGVRAADANDSDYSIVTARALRAIVVKGCGVSSDISSFEFVTLSDVAVATAGDDAEGVLITAQIQIQGFGSDSCTIAAFATADSTFRLSGTATISGTRFNETTDADEPVTLRSQALSGDAFVTSPLDNQNLDNVDTDSLVAAASGNATKTTVTKTTTKVADKKTKSEKKKAKAKYTKSIKSAKKSYAKALDKAGKSKSKKAAAKKAYAAKRASAKATYRYAIANFKLVKKSASSTENRPFSITTPVPPVVTPPNPQV